ncbi:MAG: hypothetical protein IJX89_00130 [Alphaproteobacteria bacterium]|nr:hypothetical protein [Alphaproteobacteria bacterium]
MKAINKILWAIVSAAICVVYKFEAKAECKLAVKKSTYLAATFNATTCSDANVCGSHGNSNCVTAWIKENYAHNPGNFVYFMDRYSSEITGNSTICAPGNYVHYCKVANGTAYYVGVDSYFADGLCTYVSCIACPGTNATTLNSVGYNVYDEGRGFFYDSSYSDWIYVCSTNDAVTGAALGGLYMQQVGMSCIEEKVYELFNSINDCFIPAIATLTDETGTYTCVNDSAWYE